MKVGTVVVGVILLWSGCALTQAASETTVTEGTEGRGPSVEELLTRDPDAADYSNTKRCLNRRRIRQTQVLDEKHVSVQVGRDEYYLIQFRHRCPGLRRGGAVMFETRSNLLCAHDSLRAMDDWGTQIRPGSRCPIPGFQSITKEELLYLKDALKAERRKKREAPSEQSDT